MSYDSYYRVPDDAIKEQMKAELRENKDVTDDEYIYALGYFGVNSNATENEINVAYRKMLRNNSGNSNKIQELTENYSIIRQRFKHINWKENIKSKRVEIDNKMKKVISTNNIGQNLETQASKLQQIYLKYYGKINYINTIAGLERLYNLYLEEIRSNIKSKETKIKNQSGIYIMQHDYISTTASQYPISFYLYDEKSGKLYEIKNGEVTQEIKGTEDIILKNFIPIENILLNSKKYKKDSRFLILDDTEYFSNGQYRLTMTKANFYDEDFIFLLHYGERWIQGLSQSNESIDSIKIIELLKKYLQSCIERKKISTRR